MMVLVQKIGVVRPNKLISAQKKRCGIFFRNAFEVYFFEVASGLAALLLDSGFAGA